jgi:hypothetical protein
VRGIEGRARQNIQVPVAVPGSEDNTARHVSPLVVVDQGPVVFCDGRIEGRGHEPKHIGIESIERGKLHRWLLSRCT